MADELKKTIEEQAREFAEQWERDRPAREGREKRFGDWALSETPDVPDDEWKRALSGE